MPNVSGNVMQHGIVGQNRFLFKSVLILFHVPDYLERRGHRISFDLGEVAKRGYKKAKENHNYTKRIKQLLNIINE